MKEIYRDRKGNVPRYDGEPEVVVPYRGIRNACMRLANKQGAEREEMALEIMEHIKGGYFHDLPAALLLEVAYYLNRAIDTKDADPLEGYENDPFEWSRQERPACFHNAAIYVSSVIDAAIAKHGVMP